MDTSCKTCLHPQREQIGRELVAGKSRRAVADGYLLSRESVRNHARVHLPDLLARAKGAAASAAASDLLRQAREIQARTLQALQLAEEGGNTRTMLMAVREARGNLAFLSRVLAAAEAAPQESVLLNPSGGRSAAPSSTPWRRIPRPASPSPTPSPPSKPPKAAVRERSEPPGPPDRARVRPVRPGIPEYLNT